MSDMKGPIGLTDLSHLPRPGSGVALDVCREQFWRALAIEHLECPDDVTEQFLFDHGHKAEFIKQYGHIDLRSVQWSHEALPAATLIEATACADFEGRIDEVAKALEHYAHVYGPRRWGWLEHRTWLRCPILIDGQLLHPPRRGLHLVEGHTRLGALKGYVKCGKITPSSTHQVWIGRDRNIPNSGEAVTLIPPE